MSKRERLLFAIGEADEKYVKEAEFSMKTSAIIKVAVALVVVISLSLYLFIPYAPVTSDLTDYEGSSYFPLIEEIEAYSLVYRQPKYKNNFNWILAGILDIFSFGMAGSAAPNDAAPPTNNNGSYVESTDNQVGGVIEADLFKTSDKYIFRIGNKLSGYTEPLDKYEQYAPVLRVYSIEKENSGLVAEIEIPKFNDQTQYLDMEMYLSLDCNTVTIICNYRDSNSKTNVGIVAIDVSDVNNMSVKNTVTIQGSVNTSRMVDEKLILVTNYRFYRNQVDYSDPTTFVPAIDTGSGPEPIQFEDIIYPDNVDDTDYSVLAVMDINDLSLIGASALLNFTNEIYVSEENIYISREYTSKLVEGNTTTTSNMSDIAVFGYSNGRLEEKGIITLSGWTEDQYSFDELDGYLRVVTSTSESKQIKDGNNFSITPTLRSASLYIVNLETNAVEYKVESFAPDGEQATAVRFDGDKCYVCTAVVVTFTDPVFFFDLSDYENISYNDTGIIEGYSDHLINYGNGKLLGIGREDWEFCKVEIYEDGQDGVVGTYEFKFGGNYSLDYKAYMVNRAEGLFGFAVEYYYTEGDYNTSNYKYSDCYILITIDGDNIEETIIEMDNSMRADTVRAVYIDGYLYITTETDLIVEQIK